MKQIIRLICIRRAVSGLFLGATLLLAAPIHAEDIYKWNDENNQVHYTQMPPPHGIKAIRIQRSDVPSDEDESSPTAGTEDETDQASAEDPFAEQPTSGDDTGAGEDEDARLAKAMQKNCNNARKNLKTLSRGQVRYVNPEGEIIRLTEEERQQRIAEAREQIGVLCKE